MIAIHYPARYGKEDFIKNLCTTGKILLAPYIEAREICAIPRVDNFVILIDDFSKLQEGLIPILEGETKIGGKGGVYVAKLEAQKIIDGVDKYLQEGKSNKDSSYEDEDSIIKSLEDVSIALTTERDHSKLLSLILKKARGLSKADAGSLYLLEKKDDADKESAKLRFVLAQNDSKLIKFEEKVMPLSYSSVAGYVALMGEILKIDDVYQIEENCPYSHNKEFDEETGYRSKSMLVLPMKNSRGDIIGVLQLINRKRDASNILDNPENVETFVIGFDEKIIRLMSSFSSMAAVAIENNQLIKNIEHLFEGMVEASVTAVEQRDPTTSGHSLRVSILTLALAELINTIEDGKFKDVYFSDQDLKEIRYASILHDFGKIGVREDVLTKAKKLYDWQLDEIKLRIDSARLSGEKENLLRIINIYEKGDFKIEEIKKIYDEIDEYNEFIDKIEETVIKSDQPTILPEGDFNFLQNLSGIKYRDSKGEEKLLLLPEELKVLSIPKGTLTEEERLEIESHVFFTYEFLKRIPWTEELRNVPSIAYAHHEKLNGAGYPRKIKNSEIPIPSRIMAIADIFDALSATDRPYKKAVPVEKSLDIIKSEAGSGQLDIDLVNLFIESKVYEKTLKLRQVRE